MIIDYQLRIQRYRFITITVTGQWCLQINILVEDGTDYVVCMYNT